MAHDLRGQRRFGDITREGTLAQGFAVVVGCAFLLVGILGFIPGVTTDYDMMEFAGHDSHAQLFGIFQVSVLHNIVHLLFGLAGLALARTHDTARWFLVGGGVVYLGLWLYGLAIDKTSDANVVPVNDADDWLHFGLGVGMIALGLLAWRLGRRIDQT
jgi:hypothetical protein